MTNCEICSRKTCEAHTKPAVFRVSFLFTAVRGWEFVRKEVDVCWECAEFLEWETCLYTGIDYVGVYETS